MSIPPTTPPVNFSLATLSALATDPERTTTQELTASIASVQREIMQRTPSGALMPQQTLWVPSTGAPLAASGTIKVDAADSGGAGGQVISFGAQNLAGGSTTILPGLLVQAPRSPPSNGEPPLAEQPSTLNEEAFLD